jgi:hypothetical protein
MRFWPELDGYRFEPAERIYNVSGGEDDFVAFLGPSPQSQSIFLPLVMR